MAERITSSHYQNDVRNYRLEIRSGKWLKPGKELPPRLKKMVESWVEAHEEELPEQWENAMSNRTVTIIG